MPLTSAEILYSVLSHTSSIKVWRHLKERLRNQSLSSEELQRLQWQRLQSILHHCYLRVPFYRDLWREHDVDPTRFTSPKDLRHIPVVTRRMLSKARMEGGFDQLGRKAVQLVRTSGTTAGQPFSILMDRPTYERKYANHLRQFYAAGWRLGTRSAALHHSGHGCFRGKYTGNTDQREPWHLLRELTFRLFHRRIVLPPYDAAVTGEQEIVRKWYKQIRAFRPQILDTFYINLLMLYDYVQRAGLEPPRIPRIFVLNTLTDAERRRLQDFFGAEIFNRYSPHEAEGVAFACSKHVGMHVAVDSYFLEIVAQDFTALPAGETGRVLLTDLENYDMPLIRYDIGDLSHLLEGTCTCGRSFPRIGDLEGRCVDIVCSASGAVVTPWQVERIFQGVSELRCFQVVRHGSSITLSVVPAAGSFDRRAAAELYKRRIQEVLGARVSVQVAWKDSLPLEPNGKYRFVKNGSYPDLASLSG